MTTSYSLNDHLEMMLDRVRMDCFARAIADVVKPGDRVLDLGAGAGIMSFHALRAGAEHVYAIEPGESVEILRATVDNNRLGDRITIWQEDSREVELPTKADVLIADLRGVLPVFADGIVVVRDAVARHLRPGGAVLPQRDRVSLAPLSDESARRWVDGWRTEFPADYSAMAQVAANQWGGHLFAEESLLAAPRSFHAVDYREASGPDELVFAGTYAAKRDGTLTALGAWFDCEVAPELGYSTGPGQPDTVYQRGCFPLERSCEVFAGERIDLDVRVRIGATPIWTWKVSVPEHGYSEEHCSLLADVLSPRQFRKQADRFAPTLNKKGELERFVLERFDGERTLEAIASELAQAFPRTFSGPEDARALVRRVSQRCAR